MTQQAKPLKKSQMYVPPSEWFENTSKAIKTLMDECLDRYKEDKKTSVELLKMLAKLDVLVEKKYKET